MDVVLSVHCAPVCKAFEKKGCLSCAGLDSYTPANLKRVNKYILPKNKGNTYSKRWSSKFITLV